MKQAKINDRLSFGETSSNKKHMFSYYVLNELFNSYDNL